MICFYYNVCDCHAFIKGNLLTYLSSLVRLTFRDLAGKLRSHGKGARKVVSGGVFD